MRKARSYWGLRAPHGDRNHLTYGELTDPRRRNGYARKDSVVALKTRAHTRGAVGRKRNHDVADSMATSGDLPVTQEMRRRVNDLHVASVADNERVGEHAQW